MFALYGLLKHLDSPVYIPTKEIHDIYNVRNLEAHSITGKDAKRHEEALNEIGKNPQHYFDKTYTMISKLLPLMVRFRRLMAQEK